MRAMPRQTQAADGGEGPAEELQEHREEAVSTPHEQDPRSTVGIGHADAAGPAMHKPQHNAAPASINAFLENHAQQEPSESGQQGSAREESSEGVLLAGALLDRRLGENEGASSIEEGYRGSMEGSMALNRSSRPGQLGSARGQGLASMASMQELPASSSSFRAQTACAASAEAPGSAPVGGSLIRASAQHQGVDGSRQRVQVGDGLAASSQAHVAGHFGQSMPSRGSPSRRPSTSHFSVHSGSRSPDTRMHVHRYSAQHAVANSDSATGDKQATARVGPSSSALSGIPAVANMPRSMPHLGGAPASRVCQVNTDGGHDMHNSTRAHDDRLQVNPGVLGIDQSPYELQGTGQGTVEEHHAHGYMLRKRGDFHSAIRHYSRALEAQPNHFSALFNRGFCYDKVLAVLYT